MADTERPFKRCRVCGAKNREKLEICVRCGEPLVPVGPPSLAVPLTGKIGLVVVGVAVLGLSIAVFRWMATGTEEDRPFSADTPAPAETASAPVASERNTGSGYQEAADATKEGMAAYNAGDYERALGYFQELARVSPTNATAYLYAGLCWIELADLGEAEDSLRKAVELQPSNPAAVHSLIRLLVETGNLDDAEDFQSRLVVANPYDAKPHIGLGRIHRGQGDLEGAIADLERAVELESTNQEAVLELAFTLNEAERPEEAIEVFEKALRSDSGNAAAHAGMGEALLLAERNEEAVRSLEEAVRLDSNQAGVRLRLAMAYERLDRIEDSLREYEAFVSLTDDAEMAARITELVEQARAALAERQRRE
jgi:tetratricopeptide (TPR) repeat protein